METAIRVEGLHKSYKKLHVLNGVDFEVEKGRVFALLGANGAGKTTMIRILSTLLKPDKGRAFVDNYDVVKQPLKVREAISLTGQYAALDEVLTGRENLEMTARLRHLSNVKGRSQEMLERFGLTDAADRAASGYSGGMKRRLDLAMSLIGRPTVLFLDEPTTGLDPQSRQSVWRLVKELACEGTTVFLTTQYLEEAEALADRIAILENGKTVAEGTAEELKARLPHGHLELRFESDAHAQAAKELLADMGAHWDDEEQALLVSTDGSAKQAAQVLVRLENAQTPAVQFTQKLPTLEDVFLRLTGGTDKEERS
jgi:ABC-2 type transport system ATP-binding protein